MYPKITIMIPTYNQVNFISRAIESALAQDYLNLEIVISDDCSNDGTEELINSKWNDPRLKYFKNDKNLGRVANYRHVLEDLATGDWVVNLDGDDYYTDCTFFTYAIDKINYYKDKQIVFVQAGRFNKEVGHLHEPGFAISLPLDEDEELMPGRQFFLQYHRFFISHLTTLYRRDLAKAIGFYRYNIESSDVESLLRLSLYGDVLLIKKAVAVWVGHANNTVRQITLERLDKNLLWIDGAYCEAKNLDLDGSELNSWKSFLKNRSLAFIIVWSIKVGKTKMALQYIWKNHRSFFFSKFLYLRAAMFALKRIKALLT